MEISREDLLELCAKSHVQGQLIGYNDALDDAISLLEKYKEEFNAKTKDLPISTKSVDEVK